MKIKNIFLIIVGLFVFSSLFYKETEFKKYKKIDNDNSVHVQKVNLVNYMNKEINDLEVLNRTKKQVIPWGVDSLGVEKFRDDPKPKKKIKVAILDSGIDKKHEDIVGKVVKEWNAILPGEPVIDDYEDGHGTAIAGIIAASNNDVGIVGINPNVDLYSVKILDSKGNGNVESFIKGIEWCIKEKVQIINMSFGMRSNNAKLYEAVEKAIDSGIVIVASSGNNFGKTVDYPAGYEGVISVTAVNQNYKVGHFSAKGKVDFSAPGVSILSTAKNGKYSIHNGTSLATAYVTGVVSLLLENRERFGVDTEGIELQKTIVNVLKKYSISLGDKTYFGNGFIKIS